MFPDVVQYGFCWTITLASFEAFLEKLPGKPPIGELPVLPAEVAGDCHVEILQVAMRKSRRKFLVEVSDGVFLRQGDGLDNLVFRNVVGEEEDRLHTPLHGHSINESAQLPDVGAEETNDVFRQENFRLVLLGRRFEPCSQVDMWRQVGDVDLVFASYTALYRPGSFTASLLMKGQCLAHSPSVVKPKTKPVRVAGYTLLDSFALCDLPQVRVAVVLQNDADVCPEC